MGEVRRSAALSSFSAARSAPGSAPPGDVAGSQLQPFEHDLVVVGQQRLFGQVALGLLLDLVRIVRQQPLIETCLGAQDRTVASITSRNSRF